MSVVAAVTVWRLPSGFLRPDICRRAGRSSSRTDSSKDSTRCDQSRQITTALALNSPLSKRDND